MENKTLGGQSHFNLFADSHQNIWSSSMLKGVFRIDRLLFELNELNETNLPVRKLIEYENQFWYLPSSGFLIKREGNKQVVYSHSKIDKQYDLLYPFDAHFTDKHSAWFASYGLAPAFFDGKNYYYYIFDDGKYCIDVSSFDNKEIWFATNNAGVIYFRESEFYVINESNGLSENKSSFLLHTAQNQIWVGTRNEGINLIKDNTIAYLNTQNGLIGNNIKYLYLDTQNRVWVATTSGISIIEGNKIAHLTTLSGILSNKIESISQDTYGNYWLASNKGLSKLEPLENDKFSITNYNKSSGRFVNSFFTAVTTLPNGKMAWTNTYGLVSYNPENELSESYKPTLNLNSVSIDGKKLENYHWNNEVKIEPDKNLKIDFVAIDWGNEQNIRYKYSLTKNSEEKPNWIDLGKTNTINLTEIPHGKYRLSVYAENLNTSTTQQLQLNFLPYWWLTWWAKSIWIISITGILVILFMLRIKRLEKQKKKLEKQVKERTQEISQQNSLLAQKNKQLNRLDKFKESTISMLVHDLKNPLNLILNTSQDKKVKQASFSMLNIVMNILDINKEKKAEIKISKQSLDLNSVIKKAVDRTQFLLNQKNIQLKMIFSHTHKVLVDEKLSVRIFENLLTNAIKFSSVNSNIYINTFVEGKFTKVEVKDTGNGISEELQPYIFDEFKQDKIKKSGMLGSTGLGLAFCKMAAEKQAGKIELKSKIGEGSSFFVYLPNSDKENEKKQQRNDYKTEEFEFTFEEKEILKTAINKLSEMQVYEVTKILNTLKTMENKTETISKWCNKLKTASLTANKQLYNQLIKNGL